MDVRRIEIMPCTLFVLCKTLFFKRPGQGITPFSVSLASPEDILTYSIANLFCAENWSHICLHVKPCCMNSLENNTHFTSYIIEAHIFQSRFGIYLLLISKWDFGWTFFFFVEFQAAKLPILTSTLRRPDIFYLINSLNNSYLHVQIDHIDQIYIIRETW